MSEHDPTNPAAPRRGGGPGDPPDFEPIPLEPTEPEPARPAPPSKKPRIDSPGLLDDFDEDADLESDPEVEQIVKGIPIGAPPRAAKEEPAPQPEGDPLCGSAEWKIPAAIGAVVTITAAIFAGINAENAIWAHVLIVLYWAGLHTATGLGAVVAAALLLGRRVGEFGGAAARMFLAVAVFLALFSLEIPLTGGRLEESFLGAAAYLGVLWAAFRLPPRDTGVIGGAHFGLALLVSLGNLLSAVIGSAGAAP